LTKTDIAARCEKQQSRKEGPGTLEEYAGRSPDFHIRLDATGSFCDVRGQLVNGPAIPAALPTVTDRKTPALRRGI
jgi:hypothetical protein